MPIKWSANCWAIRELLEPGELEEMPDAWARSATWSQAWTKGGRAILRGSLLLMALAGSFSCNADRCPSHLATIVERGGATYASSSDTATIENVASECIPLAEPAIETPVIKRGPRTQYEIASTATVRYATHEIFSGLAPGSAAYARVVFEAVTRSGVVLGSSSTRLHVLPGESQVAVSDEITGLAPEEVTRVSTVRVRLREDDTPPAP